MKLSYSTDTQLLCQVWLKIDIQRCHWIYVADQHHREISHSQCKLPESIILQQHMHVYRSPSVQQLLQQQHCRCKGIPCVGQHCSFLLQEMTETCSWRWGIIFGASAPKIFFSLSSRHPLFWFSRGGASAPPCPLLRTPMLPSTLLQCWQTFTFT